MKERTFRKPSVRELFDGQGIELPPRISEAFIFDLIDRGTLIFATSYQSAVEKVDCIGGLERLKLGGKNLILFPSKFRVPREDSDYGIKSLEDFVKIDSQPVLRAVSGEEQVPGRLTRGFLEAHKVWPYTLIKTAMDASSLCEPPTGFYWVGIDGFVRATTWIRATTGAEMQVMKQRGDFVGEVMDKRPYGKNLRMRVNSRTEEDENYEFTLFRLPMHRRGDIRQYSNWINIGHNSQDPDASYRGLEHDEREHPVIFWSASTIFSFHDAMRFVSEYPEWRQFRINPFPIPTNREMIDFIDNLRLRSLVIDRCDQGLHLRVLNKTEMDKFIGARTIMRGYDNCWHHWGKKDLSYLYKPES